MHDLFGCVSIELKTFTMHPKDILEAIGFLHRAQSETKNPGGDQMVIKGVDIGPSSRYYGVRKF